MFENSKIKPGVSFGNFREISKKLAAESDSSEKYHDGRGISKTFYKDKNESGYVAKMPNSPDIQWRGEGSYSIFQHLNGSCKAEYNGLRYYNQHDQNVFNRIYSDTQVAIDINGDGFVGTDEIFDRYDGAGREIVYFDQGESISESKLSNKLSNKMRM